MKNMGAILHQSGSLLENMTYFSKKMHGLLYIKFIYLPFSCYCSNSRTPSTAVLFFPPSFFFIERLVKTIS